MANVESPTALAFTPDARLLVTTQFGEVRLIDGGTLAPDPALDLAGSLCTADEMGLLGAAVDPAFTGNGFVYLYYTRSKPGRCVNRVSRFTMSGCDDRRRHRSSCSSTRSLPTGNHNGGDLHFGNDGYLYVSVGDGGCDYAGDSGCCRAERRVARPARPARQDPADHERPAASRATNPFQGAGTARCNVTGRTTAGKHVPGDVRLGAAESVPVRVRPEHRRHPLLHQRRRPGRLGGGRPRRRRAPTTAGTSARGRARTAPRRTAAPPPAGHDEPGLRLQPLRDRLRGDHRRCVRPERRLAGGVRRRLPLRRLHLRQDLPAPPRAAAAASRGPSSPPTSAPSST